MNKFLFALQNSTIVDLVNELYKRVREIEKESTTSANNFSATSSKVVSEIGKNNSKSVVVANNSSFDDVKQVRIGFFFICVCLSIKSR